MAFHHSSRWKVIPSRQLKQKSRSEAMLKRCQFQYAPVTIFREQPGALASRRGANSCGKAKCIEDSLRFATKREQTAEEPQTCADLDDDRRIIEQRAFGREALQNDTHLPLCGALAAHVALMHFRLGRQRHARHMPEFIL